MKKLSLMIMTMAVVLGVSPMALAANPRITEVEDRDNDAITLEITQEAYKNKKVDIKVRIKNRLTNKVEVRKFKGEELDKNGKIDLKLKDLAPDSKYAFKVKIRRASGNLHYSHYSEAEKVSTHK